MEVIKSRNKILKQVSDRVVKEIPLNIVFNLLLGELKETKSLYQKHKKVKLQDYVKSPCCHSDGFVIHKNTNLFKCYGCGQSGSSITLVRLIFNCEKHYAVDWLINRFKVDIKDIIHDYKIMYTLEAYQDWLNYHQSYKDDNLPF